MIKAVLFDFFGVLTEGGASLRKIFADAYGISPLTLKYIKSGMLALKGQIADEDFINEMNRRNPDARPVGKRQFEVRAGYPVQSDEVYELADKLRSRGIKTGIMSNTLRTAADSLRAAGLYDGFDPLLISCEVHLAKPDEAFYRLAIDRLGVEPGEIIFIDDAQKNLAAAEEMGMQVILAQNPEQIVRDVKALILRENGLKL